jgi:hypothetical protein
MVAFAALVLPGSSQGSIIHVATVAQLNSAVASAGSGDQIVLAAGRYKLTQELKLARSNVTLRSASGNADDVVLRGAGMNNKVRLDEAVMVKADGVRIEGVTIRSFYRNGIRIRGDLDADGTQIIGVRTLNIGRWHVRSGGNGHVSDDVLIEGVTMDQTNARQARDAGDDLIGGIYAAHISDWLVRGATIRNIHGATGNSIGAVSFSDSSGSVIEGSRLLGNGKGLAIDNSSGDIVRNNFITCPAGTGARNSALDLAFAQDELVAYNTIYSRDAKYARTIVVVDGAGKDEGGGVKAAGDLSFLYNLVRGGLTNGIGGALTLTGSLIDDLGATVVPAWFADAAAGDLRLTALATGAIDQGLPLPEVVNDVDNHPRGDAPDLGADESKYAAPEPATAVVLILGAVGVLLRKRPLA